MATVQCALKVKFFVYAGIDNTIVKVCLMATAQCVHRVKFFLISCGLCIIFKGMLWQQTNSLYYGIVWFHME